MIDRITIMGGIDESARGENGKSAGITQACSVCRVVRDLRTETERVSPLAQLNKGREPATSVMRKVFSGKVFKIPWGSLRGLRVSSPVSVMVAVTFKFSNPSTW